MPSNVKNFLAKKSFTRKVKEKARSGRIRLLDMVYGFTFIVQKIAMIISEELRWRHLLLACRPETGNNFEFPVMFQGELRIDKEGYALNLIFGFTFGDTKEMIFAARGIFTRFRFDNVVAPMDSNVLGAINDVPRMEHLVIKLQYHTTPPS
jgi:hypothetical protein